MKTRSKWVLILILTFAVSDAGAQNFRKMVGKALKGDKVEIKSKKDSTTIVEIDDASSSSNARISDEAVMKAFGLSDQVEFENEYEYDAYVKFEVSNFDKKGKPEETLLYDTYVRRDETDYAMVFYEDDTKSTYIYDSGNSAMMILTDADGEKSGFATNFDPDNWDTEDEEVGSLTAVNMTKTGQSKEIIGYMCEEYKTEDAENDIHIWVSKEAGNTVKSPMLSNQQLGGTFSQGSMLDGMIMEYDIRRKTDERRTIMLVIDLDMYHTHSISTKEYPVIAIKKEKKEEKKKKEKE